MVPCAKKRILLNPIFWYLVDLWNPRDSGTESDGFQKIWILSDPGSLGLDGEWNPKV